MIWMKRNTLWILVKKTTTHQQLNLTLIKRIYPPLILKPEVGKTRRYGNGYNSA